MSHPRQRRVPGGLAQRCVALLVALGVLVGGPGHAAAAQPALAGAAAIGRAALVTLKIPGTARLHGVLVDHSLDADEAMEEEDGDVGDFTVGSAVMIEASGIAVTTARLGRLVSALEAVTSDGRRLTVTVVGRDDKSDVAVLSVCCDTRPFPHAVLGNSDRVRAGDWVVALGAPFGLEASATASVVAAVRSADAEGLLGVILTGGSVTAGYAGGPLVDTTGALIGLVVGNSGGAGLALPSNAVKKIALTLLEHGRLRRGWLGFTGQPLNPALARALGARDAQGVVVVDVRHDSPAARAGLRPGDVVYEVDGRRFGSATRMAAAIGTLTPGHAVALRVWQRGREAVLVLPLGEEPDENAAGSRRSRTKARLGMEVGTITSDMGVVVSDAPPEGAAACAGIRRGDVIRELNGRSIRSMADFDAVLGELSPHTRMVVLVQRGATSFYITVVPAAR